MGRNEVRRNLQRLCHDYETCNNTKDALSVSNRLYNGARFLTRKKMKVAIENFRDTNNQFSLSN